MQEFSQEPRDVAAEGLKAFKQVDHEFAVLLVHNVVLVGLDPEMINPAGWHAHRTSCSPQRQETVRGLLAR